MALQRLILDLGIDNEILNYQPDALEGARYYIYNPTKLRHAVKRRNIARAFSMSPNRSMFVTFYREHMRWSKPVKNQLDARKLSRHYDVFICGSDQLWKPTSFNPLYYLSFCDDSAKRIAYGLSLGIERIQDFNMRRARPYLEKFDAISLREDLLREDMQDLLGKEVSRVCDPTLLFDSSFYLPLRSKDSAEGCLFCYFTKNGK